MISFWWILGLELGNLVAKSLRRCWSHPFHVELPTICASHTHRITPICRFGFGVDLEEALFAREAQLLAFFALLTQSDALLWHMLATIVSTLFALRSCESLLQSPDLWENDPSGPEDRLIRRGWTELDLKSICILQSLERHNRTILPKIITFYQNMRSHYKFMKKW